MKSSLLCLFGATLLTSCGGKSASPTKPVTTQAVVTAQPKTLAEVCATSKTVLAAANVASKAADGVGNSGDGVAEGNASNKVASLKDLEALARTKSHSELLGRAQDVPPAKRNARWDELVAGAAIGYVGAASAKGDPRETLAVAHGVLESAPTVRKSSTFMELYAKAAGLGIKACVQQSYSGNECIKLAREITQTNPDNVELLKGVADAIYGSTGAKYVAAPFYDRLIVGRVDSPYCQDPSLVKSITSGLETPADDDIAASARDVAAYWCFSQFESQIKAGLAVAEPNAYLVENGCAVLKGKGAVN